MNDSLKQEIERYNAELNNLLYFTDQDFTDFLQEKWKKNNCFCENKTAWALNHSLDEIVTQIVNTSEDTSKDIFKSEKVILNFGIYCKNCGEQKFLNAGVFIQWIKSKQKDARDQLPTTE